MFCACRNIFDADRPNENVCPVCAGHPGTLPTINKSAVEAVLKVGMALAGDVPIRSKFDRKNYFYPDLPKGYQISQYDEPLIQNAILNGVRIKRIHLEEDAGRLLHEKGKTFVDFNRAGTPLMELVTEPDIKSAEEAGNFAKELQLVLRYLGVSDADMEKGQMRVEVNISLKKQGDEKLGTKVEVKNIGSFKAAESAIRYETERQAAILERGEKVIHETRGWDDGKQATVSQRGKEEAHDYRYFPEPDLPPLDMAKFDLKAIQKEIPELPQAKRVRFTKEYGLKQDTVEVLVSDRDAAKFFEEAVSELETEDKKNLSEEVQLLANYLNSDLKGLMLEKGVGFSESKVTPENFSDLIELVSHGTLGSRAAKDILKIMMERGGDPRVILKEEGLEQVSDESALLPLIGKILAANPQAVADYRKGKQAAIMFMVGKAMGELKGAGNPQVLKKLFEEKLK